MLVSPPIEIPPGSPAACESWICGSAEERDADPLSRDARGGFEAWCPEFRDTEHFRIHYAVEGEHALPGWPDPAYLENLAESLEDVLRFYHEALGLPIPPSDGSFGGGEGLIDCYCFAFDDYRHNWIGFARPLDGVPGCTQSMTGLFCLNNSKLGGRSNEYIRKTAGHELFHVVQYGISGYSPSWFAESTAEWAAGRASSTDPFYLHAHSFLATPYLPLYNTATERAYGARIFWDALEQFVAPNVPADIWLQTCEAASWDAIELEIESRGHTLNGVLHRFAEWNAYTGSRDDGAHYREGATLSEVRMQAEHEGFPVVDAVIEPSFLAQVGGSNYIRFHGPGGRSGLRIEVHGNPSISIPRFISVLAKGPHGQTRVAEVAPDSNGLASVTIPGWSEASDFTLIVTHGFPDEPADDDLSYTYSAIPTDGPFPTLSLNSESPLSVFPNPTVGPSTIQFEIEQAGEASVTVFDVAGRNVAELARGAFVPGVYRVQLEATQNGGAALSSGIYFVRLNGEGVLVNEKVVVIRSD